MSSLTKEIEKTEIECTNLFKKLKELEKQLQSTKEQYKLASNKLKTLKKSKCDAENKEKIQIVNSILESEWVEPEFEWSKRLRDLLKDKFKFYSFRPKQLAAINATLSKKDVLLVMPTGGGKSLVYQLPALIGEGFTVVVSPLLSLIEDQLVALNKLGIKATTINSATSKEDIKQIYDDMSNKNSKLKLLYVTPEWLAKSKRFMARLKKCYEEGLVDRVAIDEVHCCSTWGHDFRQEYGYLGILRPILANVPFIGLTATATMSVLTDVQTMLTLENCMIITAPFNRPNLYYKVKNKPTSKEAVLDYLEKCLTKDYANQSGIIYTTTISDSISLTTDLQSRGLKVAPYHGQLEPEQKKKIHMKWLNKTYQAVIATVAFGMGIDKPDVRFVIHHSIPKSMESLYQESGRAGRDGEKADCIVLFSLNDYFKIIGMVGSVRDEKSAISVLEYCLNQTNCRRALIAVHFEEIWDSSQCNKMCDYCRDSKSEQVYYNLTKICKDLHSLIMNADQNEEKLTLIKLLDGWYQTGNKKLRLTTLDKPKIARQQAEYIVSYLLLKNYLTIDKGYSMYSTICYIQRGKEVEKEIEMLTCEKFVGLSNRYVENGESSAKKPRLNL